MPRHGAHHDTEVLIAGGGFAGLTLAVALRQALGQAFSVTVADPTLGTSHADDERASAIVAAARRLFETIGVWDRVADEAQPILDMVVTDSRLNDAMRPTFLTFAGEVEPGEPFAHMVDNRRLVAALAEKARGAGVDLRTGAVTNFGVASDGIHVEFGDGGALIEGRNGLYEVYAGDPVPGLGRIDAIRKQDGRWVVVTSRGLVVSR